MLGLSSSLPECHNCEACRLILQVIGVLTSLTCQRDPPAFGSLDQVGEELCSQ